MDKAKPAKFTSEVWAALGQAKLDNTWHTYRRLASFQWVNSDPENSAFVSMTHVNSSGYTDPPGPTGANGPSPPPTPCGASKWLVGKDALTIGTGHDFQKISNSTAAVRLTNEIR